MNQISLALGHWGTGALAPDQTISRELRPNGSLDHQDSRRGPQVNISNLPPICVSQTSAFSPLVLPQLPKNHWGNPMKSPLKSLDVRIWGSRCSHISRTPCCIICRWKLGSRRCCTPAGWHLRLPALHRCKKGARQPVRFPAGDGIWLTVSLHVS